MTRITVTEFSRNLRAFLDRIAYGKEEMIIELFHQALLLMVPNLSDSAYNSVQPAFS